MLTYAKMIGAITLAGVLKSKAPYRPFMFIFFLQLLKQYFSAIRDTFDNHPGKIKSKHDQLTQLDHRKYNYLSYTSI